MLGGAELESAHIVDFKEQVKSQVDIVRVVGDYVRLRKSGSTRYMGLCPFHSEKTPSFSVESRLQIFKCFGCGKGGDVFTFVMEHQGLSFFEALKLLAEQHGIPIPERRDPEASDATAALREALYRAHEIAQEHFAKQLRSRAAREAREYLERRGLNDETIERFGIGYAPAGNRLTALLRGKGLSEEQLLESSLAGRSESRPDLYDFFRDRITFPIHGHTGKVIGFGARALRDDQQPKYLNSGATKIYDKSAVLYNLHRAKEVMRRDDRVILAEGYMDVIGVAGAGVDEAVACCGTRLTPQHARALRRLCDTVIVNFDSDDAGRAAAEKSIEALLHEGFQIRVLELPDGKDPDEFCREKGAEAYRSLVDQAPGYYIWLAERARKRFDMKTAEGRVAAFEFLKPSVNLVPDRIKRAALANDLADHLGVDAGLVLEEFRRAASDRSRRPLPQAPRHTLGPGERLLLELFLESKEARDEMLEETLGVTADAGLSSHALFQALLAAHRDEEHFQFPAFEARLDERDRESVSQIVFDRDRGAATLDDGRRALGALRQQRHQQRYRAVRREIAEAEKTGDRVKALELLKEKSDLERDLRSAGADTHPS